MRYEEEMKHRVFMETQELNKKLEEAEARAETIAAEKDNEIKDLNRKIEDLLAQIEELKTPDNNKL